MTCDGIITLMANEMFILYLLILKIFVLISNMPNTDRYYPQNKALWVLSNFLRG